MRLDILVAVAALILWIGGGSWYWTCKVKGHCNPETEEIAQLPTDAASTPIRQLPGFHVAAGAEKLFSRKDPLVSKIGTPDLIMTISLEDALDSLGAHLIDHESSMLEVTGLYAPSEGEESSLGLQRARALGASLQQRGVEAEQLVFSYGTIETDAIQDSLIPSARAQLVTLTSDEEVDATLFEPNNLYFEFGKTDLPVTDEFRNYCTRVITYLRSHPDAMLFVTGHTDNVGAAEKNRQVGLDRAKRVAGVLQSFGVNENQMTVSSEGMNRPIADNGTDEGRSKNRRVEIRLNGTD